MPLIFDENGLQIQTLPEVTEQLVTDYQSIYGADIDLSSATPDGQRVGIEAKLAQDFQQGLLALWNSFDPDLAQGEQLIKIAKLSGTFPRAAVKSTWVVTVTADRAVTLASGYQIQDGLGQTWSTTAETVIAGSGDTDITFTADRWGAVQPDAGDPTAVTVILGVTAFASGTVTVGVEAETDAEFRARRQASLANPAYSVVGALAAKLGGLGGVTQVRIYENDTDAPVTYDAGEAWEFDLPAHSLWVVLLGGTTADIAEVIAKQKTMGCALYSSGTETEVTTTVTETIDLPSGETFEVVHSVAFDRPAEHAMTMQIVATDLTGAELSATAKTLLKEAMVAYSFKIGTGVSAGEFYALGYAALPSQVVLVDIAIADGAPCAGICFPGTGRIFTLDAADITILAAVP